jgi:lipoprotein-releasing system ATP-binding protein
VKTETTPLSGIELQHVSKIYSIESHSVPALRDVSLSIPLGSIVAVIGKSGSGKSTLLHIVGALDRATKGAVRFNGLDLSRMEDQIASNFRNSTVGFIFQMNNLLQDFSAIENVMMPGLIAGFSSAVSRQRAKEMLNAVGLSHRTEHRPGELSGGEQQRVAIARALLMSPPLLLADEPTGNLDNKTSQDIQELLLTLCRDLKMTMLLVTHDLDLANRLPHRITMADGQVVDRGIF